MFVKRGGLFLLYITMITFSIIVNININLVSNGLILCFDFLNALNIDFQMQALKEYIEKHVRKSTDVTFKEMRQCSVVDMSFAMLALPVNHTEAAFKKKQLNLRSHDALLQ